MLIAAPPCSSEDRCSHRRGADPLRTSSADFHGGLRGRTSHKGGVLEGHHLQRDLDLRALQCGQGLFRLLKSPYYSLVFIIPGKIMARCVIRYLLADLHTPHCAPLLQIKTWRAKLPELVTLTL